MGADAPSHHRVAIVTGCSSGIGLATAVVFARAGWAVTAVVRDLGRSAALRDAVDSAGADATIVAADVRDAVAVDRVVGDVVRRHGRIDVVVSNAGVGVDGTLEELTVDDFRDALDVNFLGTVRMVKAVLPVMRAAGQGRIIAVSSIAGVLGQPFNDAYCASKFALEGLFESLHPVAASVGVELVVVEPGPVTGEFVAKSSGPLERDPSAPYAAARARFGTIQASGYAHAQSNQEVADVILHAATIEAPPLRMQTNDAATRLVALKLKDLDGSRVTGLTRTWI
jgi:NAD(P)-dependent dehydrogenase (short-subunit alcohol dehydrogenase family)